MNNNQTTRVVVGMSGGVDSSAAAALLKEQGYQVVGITLKLWPQDCRSRAEDKCCGPQAVMDARSVCHDLNIPFYLVDEADEFKRQVIDYFASEYRAGRTPNPCIMCNEKLKFGSLLARAAKLGATHVATGHYARIEAGRAGRFLLKRARIPKKDQSYFLFSLSQHQLAHTLLPLGHLSKEDTRTVAREAGLKTAEKQESMEICFVPDNNYGKFLTTSAGVVPHQGEFVDRQGKVLGYHPGVEFFTVGQRKGLGLSTPRPLYVVELDAQRNRIVLGEEADLECEEFLVENCNWIPFETPPAQVEATVKIRYQHAGTSAIITPLPSQAARVKLLIPQRAITPGQACVFYQDDLVLGGGWIGRPHKKS